MLRLLVPALLFCSPLALAQELPAGAFARLGGTALRHPERPLALAFRTGTAELASLGSDGTVKIWDTKTGKELHTLRKKDSQANGMAMSANGTFLAVHFDGNLLRIYDASRKYEQVNSVAVKMLEGMTLTDDGRLVAGMQAGRPALIETSNGLDRMELFDGSAVAVAPDGKSVAVGKKDAQEFIVIVFEVPSGKVMLRMVRPGDHKANISSVAYAPDSRTLAMASDDGAPIVVFALGKEEPLGKIDGSGPVTFANGEKLFGRNDGKLSVWHPAGKLLSQNLGKEISAYTLSGDGKLAATDSGGLLGSPRIRMWNVVDGKELSFGEESLTGLVGVASRPDRGVSVTTDSRVTHWLPLATGEKPVTLDREVKAYPGVLVANSIGRELQVVATNKQNPEMSFTYGTEPIGFPKYFALSSPALGIAVHPEGKSFAAITRDGFVRVWDATGKELWTARTARSLRAGIAYSPDGKTLAVTSIIRVALFDSAEGKLLGAISRQWEEGPFTSVCFNHDGSLIAAGTQGSAGSGVVYEFASRRPVKRFEGNCGSVIGVAFAAKSDVLVTAHSDDSLLAWKLVAESKADVPLAKHWEALLCNDAAVAWPAMMALVAAKDKGVATIEEALKMGRNIGVEKAAEFELRKQRAAVVLGRIGSAEAKQVLEGMKK